MRRRHEETPQDELDAPRSGRVRDYLDNSRDLYGDLVHWMNGSRWRLALIGVLAILVAFLWAAGLLWVARSGQAEASSGLASALQAATAMLGSLE